EKLGTPVRLVAVANQGTGATDADIADRVVHALTDALAASEQKSGIAHATAPERFAVEGTLAQVQNYFDAHHWTDGLPIVPPTEEAVAARLRGTSHKPDEIVTRAMSPEGWPVTVEKVAINGVMAGAPPEAMPVLLAAVEAFGSGPVSSRVGANNFIS